MSQISIPKTSAMISLEIPEYKAKADKICDMTNRGEIIRLRRGLYCYAPKNGEILSTETIANNLYGPSYISFETALSWYEIIPERITVTRSATIHRAKQYNTPIGQFEYIKIPDNVYPIGIQKIKDGENVFLIASKEKALCDLLYTKTGLRISSPKSLRIFLEENQRIDLDEYRNCNIAIFEAYAASGYKTPLFSALERLMKNDFI